VAALLPIPTAARPWFAGPLERRDYGRLAAVEELSGAALCLRRDVLLRLGGLDESFFFYGEDVDLCWRLAKAGWSAYYVPQAVVIHHWGGSRRRLAEEMSLLAQRAYVRLFRKHRPRPVATLLTLICLAITLLKAMRRLWPLARQGAWREARRSWQPYRQEIAWLRDR
jgi:GT2 family glycosyltransferase